MPPKAPYQSLTPPDYADREPVWTWDGFSLYFIRSVAQVPTRMDLPAKEQAIWRFDRKGGVQQMIPGTEDALGVAVGRQGQLLWPRKDGESAALWTVQSGRVGPVISSIDMAMSYYGQFNWDEVFAWWSDTR
jgi:hypothetical protein